MILYYDNDVMPTKKKKIKKKKKSNKKEENKVELLNPNEKMYCQLYFGGGEYFGNGVWSYIKAFNFDVPLLPISFLKTKEKKKYNVARSGSSDLLAKPHIINEGNKILDSLFKEEIVDRELTKIIMQDKDKMSKNVAIREFNRLKSRVSDKIDLTSKGKQIQPIIEIIKYGTTAKN